MYIVARCSNANCGKTYTRPETEVGRQGKCSCGQEFTIADLKDVPLYNGKSISDWMRIVEKQGEGWRLANDVLHVLNSRAAPYAIAIGHLLEHENDSVVEWAAFALASLGEHAAPALALITKACSHHNYFVRAKILNTLYRLGPIAKSALPEVLISLDDEKSMVRKDAIAVLANLEKDAAPAAPKLARLLEHDPDRDIRAVAADALGRIGVAIPAVIDALLKGVASGDWEIRNNCQVALKRLGNQGILQQSVRRPSPEPEQSVNTGKRSFLSWFSPSAASRYHKLIRERFSTQVGSSKFSLLVFPFSKSPAFAAAELGELYRIETTQSCAWCGQRASTKLNKEEATLSPLFSWSDFRTGPSFIIPAPLNVNFPICAKCRAERRSASLSLYYVAPGQQEPPELYVVTLSSLGVGFSKAWTRALMKANKDTAMPSMNIMPKSLAR